MKHTGARARSLGARLGDGRHVQLTGLTGLTCPDGGRQGGGGGWTGSGGIAEEEAAATLPDAGRFKDTPEHLCLFGFCKDEFHFVLFYSFRVRLKKFSFRIDSV